MLSDGELGTCDGEVFGSVGVASFEGSFGVNEWDRVYVGHHLEGRTDRSSSNPCPPDRAECGQALSEGESSGTRTVAVYGYVAVTSFEGSFGVKKCDHVCTCVGAGFRAADARSQGLYVLSERKWHLLATGIAPIYT